MQRLGHRPAGTGKELIYLVEVCRAKCHGSILPKMINPPVLGFNMPHRLSKARGDRQAARAGVCLPSSPPLSTKGALVLRCYSPSAPP